MARLLISDAQWEILRLDFDPHARPQFGRSRRDARRMLNGVLSILRTGAPWRDLPEEFSNWATVYEYFSKCRKNGTFEATQQRILPATQSEEPADVVLWFVDSTILRATRAAAGANQKWVADREPDVHALGRARGGFSTKVHTVCDVHARPVGIHLTGG